MTAPVEPLESVTFRARPDERDECDDLASLSGLSRSDVIRMALREGLPVVRRRLEQQ